MTALIAEGCFRQDLMRSILNSIELRLFGELIVELVICVVDSLHPCILPCLRSFGPCDNRQIWMRKPYPHPHPQLVRLHDLHRARICTGCDPSDLFRARCSLGVIAVLPLILTLDRVT